MSRTLWLVSSTLVLGALSLGCSKEPAPAGGVAAKEPGASAAASGSCCTVRDARARKSCQKAAAGRGVGNDEASHSAFLRALSRSVSIAVSPS